MKKHDYQISPHVYDSETPTEVNPEGPQLPWRAQAFHIGNGDILIGGIDGYDFQEGGHGHPRLSITEAREFRAEMLKRWNLMPAIIDVLEQADLLCTRFGPSPESCDGFEQSTWNRIRATLKLAKAEGAHCEP